MEMTFGDKLRLHRLMKKMSRAELARRFNIAETTLAGYERDEREPKMKLIVEFAEFFGVTTDYLMGSVVVSEDTKQVLAMIDMKDYKSLKSVKFMIDGRELSDAEFRWMIDTVQRMRDIQRQMKSPEEE